LRQECGHARWLVEKARSSQTVITVGAIVAGVNGEISLEAGANEAVRCGEEGVVEEGVVEEGVVEEGVVEE
jgi:hypothetical protein